MIGVAAAIAARSMRLKVGVAASVAANVLARPEFVTIYICINKIKLQLCFAMKANLCHLEQDASYRN